MDNTEPNKLFSKDQAVLFILLDAFRWDYLNRQDSPTLFQMSQNSIYVKKLQTSSGFAQRSTISTGALPDTHGSYAMYTFDPRTSPYKILSPFKKLFAALPKSGLFYKFTRKIINQIPKFTKSWAPPGRIPSEILPLISVKEDLHPIDQPGGTTIESLYDKLREKNIKFKYYMAPVAFSDNQTETQILSDMDQDYQVLFVQFSDTDGKVHESGTESMERKRVVAYTDQRIKNLKEKFEERHENPWIVLVGDHGMVDVHTYIDIFQPIVDFAKSHQLNLGQDYLMFLDSTLARFWFFNPQSREILTPFLKTLLKEGEFMTEEYMKSRHIPINRELYGELIWKTNAGVGIFPDYFHALNEKYKAMHGFDCTEDSMKGTAVFYNKNLSEPKAIEAGSLEDVCSTVCDILALPYPAQNQGKSFLTNL